MAPRIDAQALKARVSCVEVAHELGQTPSQRAVRAGQAMTCPLPHNHKHGDRDPSCAVYVNHWKCHGPSCGAGGDVFALWAAFMGLDVKRDFPRVLADVANWAGVDVTKPRRLFRPPPAPAHTRPAAPAYAVPDAEKTARVAHIWSRAERVSPWLDAWCARRGLDAELVAMFDLLRLAQSADVAAEGWGPSGRRIVASVYDACGLLVNLRARCIDGGGTPKELPLAGHGLTARAFACPLMRRLLEATKATKSNFCGLLVESDNPLDAILAEPEHTAAAVVRAAGVVIVEGLPDYLTAATVYGDATEAPAVLGVWSGSLPTLKDTSTSLLLAAIPDNTRVTLVSHNDAGTAYMQAAAARLAGRCDVWVAPFDRDRDLNDTLQHGGAARVRARLAASKRVI